MFKNLMKICWIYLFVVYVAGYVFWLEPSVRFNPYVTFLFALGVYSRVITLFTSTG